MKQVIFTAVLLCAAEAARAEDPRPPVRVVPSHRVDVIPPGERVETAIDRMRRATNPTKAIERPVERPAVRGPSATERAAQQPADAQRQSGTATPQQAPSGGQGPPHR
ncbi:MAG TPA: hypothetical protein VH083_14355 [Myxococcales bacterium]|jgi:hypothetical protein|nr:hypothetical protein [Myxococcales bacterium]